MCVNTRDVSEQEDEVLTEGEEYEEEPVEVKLLRSVIGSSSRPKIEVPTYDGFLNAKELVDWIKYFDYDELDEEKKVKFVVTGLQGYATLWWMGVQEESKSKNKQKIKSWDKMVEKLKGKFLP